MGHYDYQYITRAEDLGQIANEVSSAKVIGMDTETEGFDPYLGRIRLLSLNVDGRVYVIDLFQTKTLVPLDEAMRETPAVWVAQNLKFDAKWLWHHYKIRLKTVFDTMRASYLIYNGLNKKHGLYDLYDRELDLDPVAKDLGGSNWSGPLSEEQLDYAAEDVILLPRLRDILRAKLIEDGLGKVGLLEMQVVFPEARMELAGFRLDTRMWLELAEETRLREHALRLELLHELPTPGKQRWLFAPDKLEAPLLGPRPQEDLDDDEDPEDDDSVISRIFREGKVKKKKGGKSFFNVESNKQVLDSLRRMGLQDDEGKLIASTSELVLAGYAKEYAIVRKLLKHREYATQLKMFGPEYLKFVHPITGRIHGGLFPFTGAGRYSMSRPNLLQLPRDKRFRQCFRPKPGKKLVICDFSQIELRLMAQLSKDEALISAYSRGLDVHKQTAEAVTGIKLDSVSKERAKELRQLAKACIAEGQLVLTSNGLKPIESVDLSDYLWDGTDWVAHEGVVYKGYQEVLTYDGLTATKDHQVYLAAGGCIEFGAAAAGNRRLGVGGDGEVPLRYDHPNGKGSAQWVTPSRRDLQCLSEDVVAVDVQYSTREDDGVYVPASSQVRQRSTSTSVGGALRRDVTAVHSGGQRTLQELWGSGHSAKVRQQRTLHSLDAGSSTARGLQRGADRPREQRRALRTRQLAVGISTGELTQQAQQRVGRLLRGGSGGNGSARSHQKGFSTVYVGSRYRPQLYKSKTTQYRVVRNLATRWSHRRADTATTFAHVYDIVNAGPQHRFVVQNRVVANCNFGLIYGLGAAKFVLYSQASYGVTFSFKQAQDTVTKFFDLYKGVKAWHQQTIQFRKPSGQTRTLSGRRRFLDPVFNHNAFLNTPCQGTGADGLKRALYLVMNLLDTKYAGRAEMVLAVHDEIILEADDDPEMLQTLLHDLTACMEEGMAEFVTVVPVIAEGGIGDSWAEKA